MGLFFLLVVLLLLEFTQAAGSTPSVALDGCPQKCGNLTIPYPFGLLDGCSRSEGFLLTCNDTFNPPRLTLETTDLLQIQVTNISYDSLTISYTQIASLCPPDQGESSASFDLGDLPYTLSTTRNKLTVLGCNSVGIFSNQDGTYDSCVSFCGDISSIPGGVCNGEGCCQAQPKAGTRTLTTMIASGLVQLPSSGDSRVASLLKQGSGNGAGSSANGGNATRCSVAFVVQDGVYNFSSSDLVNFTRKEVPVELEWAVGAGTNCSDASKSAGFECVGGQLEETMRCVDSGDDTRRGYRCLCAKGYDGNPYLPNGCQDIDECLLGTHNCVESARCRNKPGEYICKCPKNTYGDGLKDGKGCVENTKVPRVAIIVICIGAGALIVLLGFIGLRWWNNKRNQLRNREEHFIKNGGLLLRQDLVTSSHHGHGEETVRLFSEDELKAATGGFSQKRVLGRGGNGEVYKGTLPDQTEVAIKRSTQVDEMQVGQFVNEIKLLSKVAHKNVVKLVGCCLETKIPLLVYEYVPHGTLYDLIHSVDGAAGLSWPLRLQIASDAAEAIAHLHSARRPIIHRDIKSANILMDDNFTAKVADFGASRLAPLDENDEATMVLGTRGYLDPEYYETGIFSDRSDVYSFGVVLAELITGKKAIWCTSTRTMALSTYLLEALGQGTLLQILDGSVRVDGDLQQVAAVAEIARKCLEKTPEKRPSMRQVADELRGMRGVSEQSRSSASRFGGSGEVGGRSLNSWQESGSMSVGSDHTPIMWSM